MNRAFETTCAILAGCGLDLLLGDPHFLYHPVRLIGLLISALEKALRKAFPKTKGGEKAAGFFLVIFTLFFTALGSALLLRLAEMGGSIVHFLVKALMVYSLLAARSLRDESMKVYRKLKAGDLPGARKAVSMIVGRDTEKLTEEGVAKAAVETVAENASDGVIAPLFFLALGGPVLGWLYKAVNTMDSMVGYRNDRYRYFGTAAAKLDDAVNFLPSRMAGIAMVLCSKQAGLDRKGAWKIFLRDRRNHASPNSAQTEAAMAGALNVQLAGDAYYFGKLVKKKTIGDPVRRIAPEDIRSACRLMYFASAFIMVILVLIRIIAAEFLCR